MAGAHGDVGLLFEQIDQPVGDRQVDIDLRIAGEEIGQRRRQLVQAECGAGIDAQRAARRAAHAHDFGLGLLDIGDDPPGAGQEAFALRRQHQAAGAALQEAGAKAVLQPRNELRDGRGVRPKSLAAARETTSSRTRTKTRRSDVASIFVPIQFMNELSKYHIIIFLKHNIMRFVHGVARARLRSANPWRMP